MPRSKNSRLPVLPVLPVLGIAASSVIAAIYPCLAAEEKVEWVLEQNSHFFGKQVLFICRDAVKITNASGYQFELLAKAPSWKEYVVKRSDKVYAVAQHFDLQGNLFATFGKMEHSKPGPFLTQGTVNSHGMRCTKYFEPEHQSYSLTANDINVDPKIPEIISDYYRIPYFKSVPIANWSIKNIQPEPKKVSVTTVKNATIKGASGAKDPLEKPFSSLFSDYGTFKPSSPIDYKFDTLSCKRVKYNPADFALPGGLTEVKDIAKVVVGSDQKEELESLLDNIGFKSEQKKKPTKLPSNSD